MTKKLGTHIILELSGCRQNLSNKVDIEKILEKAVKSTNSTLISTHSHFFPIENNDMGGVSGIAILLESHISIHTWLEYEYVAIDIFTCGSHTAPEKAIPVFIEYFKPTHIKAHFLDRGF